MPAFLCLTFFGSDVDYFSSWTSHIIAFVSIFTVTYILFAVGALGGGDAKLCSAFALWTGLSGLTTFLFFMGVVGGFLGLATLALARHRPIKSTGSGWIEMAQKGEKKVPYGVAIAFGALASFFYTGYLDPGVIRGFVN